MRRLGVITLAAFVALTAVPSAFAEQGASKQRRLPAGFIDAGFAHSCIVVAGGLVRCWGLGDDGRLGYGHTVTIGDDEVAASGGTVYLGPGRKARALAAGGLHTCVILDNGKVRCWGFNDFGQLGYGSTSRIGDNELPGTHAPVNLGANRRAVAITAGTYHTCAILDNGAVRCWGAGANGRLGYGNTKTVGDNESPAAAGPVKLGAGRKAVAISAGGSHTCAILDNGRVRCWGWALHGQLGLGTTSDVGDNETPGAVAPVHLGSNIKAVALSSGLMHTCAILHTRGVRCWGSGGSGRLGYGNTTSIGDNETPASAGLVNLGDDRWAIGISVGDSHTCALLDTGAIRCWGLGTNGRLGYSSTASIGDNELPGSVGPVDLGPGLTAVAVAAGGTHTCAVLDTGGTICWGSGANGRLGYGPTGDIGDNEAPAFYGPVLTSGLVPTKVLPALSLSVKPKRDTTAPYVMKASGKLTGFIGDGATCAGVLVRAKKGAKTVTRHPKLKPSAGGCSYSVQFAVPSKGTWNVTAKFGGNSSLLADAAPARTFRAG